MKKIKWDRILNHQKSYSIKISRLEVNHNLRLVPAILKREVKKLAKKEGINYNSQKKKLTRKMIQKCP